VKHYCRLVGDAAIHEVREADILKFWAAWKERYAHNTLYHSTAILRRILRHLERNGGPHIELPHVKMPRAREIVATQEQLDALLGAAKPHMRLFILLCWQMALRFAEALRVTPRSFDTATNTVRIIVKGGKERTLPVTPDVLAHILPTLRHGDPDESCVSLINGRKTGMLGVRAAWNRLCKKLGISNLNPHDLRRTTATRLYHASNHDLRAVQQYLGHDSMASTVRYIAPSQDEQLREYHRLLNFFITHPTKETVQ
jgi:integrase